jgi:hypothetical protein
MWTQFAFATVYAVAVGTALSRAMALAGHLYIPHRDDLFTASADVWPGAWRDVWPLVLVVAALAPLVCAGLALLGTIELTITRATRGHMWWWLLAGTVVAAGAAGFGLAGPGVPLLIWLLD